VRTIFSSAWEDRQSEGGSLLVYRVRGNGFLHHMVRNLVGTMLDVGRGRLPLSEIPSIIAARSRSAAGPTAPARGLFLHSVEYDEQKLDISPHRRSRPAGRETASGDASANLLTCHPRFSGANSLLLPKHVFPRDCSTCSIIESCFS